MDCEVASGNNSVEIDEDLHSRQLAVYGRETMRRLIASNVLVSGLHGLGVEIVKNLVLDGVKSITLHDEGKVELWDLASNFYFSEDDVGKNRATACVQMLQGLNNADMITGSLTKAGTGIAELIALEMSKQIVILLILTSNNTDPRCYADICARLSCHVVL